MTDEQASNREKRIADEGIDVPMDLGASDGPAADRRESGRHGAVSQTPESQRAGRTDANGRTADTESESGGLREAIIRAAAERPNRALPFRDFMEMCLYHPRYGYYMREQPKVGKSGDFYTSASIGTVLGDMLADYYIAWAASRGGNKLTLVEWGGGDGRLAKQVLDRVAERDPGLYGRTELVMLEVSPHHRRLQRENLSQHARVRWLDEAAWHAEAPWRDVYLWANELLDAFPVHRVKKMNGVLHEIGVSWDERNERFAEVYEPLQNRSVLAYLEEQGIKLLEGQIAEVNVDAVRWIERLAGQLADSHVTLIDYGHESDELYAPHRMAGTLMCYRRHIAASDPYVYVGEQDITSHVDFTAARNAAQRAGFRDVKVVSQAEYLLAGGVLGWLQDHHDPDPFSPVARRNRSIRQLLLSDQMSELFKVLTMRI